MNKDDDAGPQLMMIKGFTFDDHYSDWTTLLHPPRKLDGGNILDSVGVVHKVMILAADDDDQKESPLMIITVIEPP